MPLPVALLHRTEYRYDKPVALGPQIIQLRPAPHARTPIRSYALDISPADRILNWQFDPLANHVARAVFPSKTESFTVEVNLTAELTPINPFDFLLEPGFARYPFGYSPEAAHDLAPYRTADPAGTLLRGFLGKLSRAQQDTIGLLSAVNQRVCNEIAYNTRMEHGVQTCEQTLSLKTGSCRDSAWLLVQIFRSLGIAARFVSGYLIQLVPDEPGPNSPKQDSADLHAWAEVFLPGAGWVGLDATSGMFTAEGHIPLCCAPTPLQAAPIGGTVEPSGVEFTHTMTVRRFNQAPTLTQPFTEDEWQKLRAVAHAVDRSLDEQNVRLTMGGEPTYVGVDHAESPQWNLDALGPDKRERGLALIRRLRERTAPGGLLHLGQGKWYPNEALPRWAFHCLSRVDGVPVWENLSLIALPDHDYGFSPEKALEFLEALTHRLEVPAADILPAFNYGEDAPAGYLIPLRRRQPAGTLSWSSLLWVPRPDRLILSTGDSPIGYRIPVAAMPFVAPDELAYPRNAEGEIALPTTPARRPDVFTTDPKPDPLPPQRPDPEAAPELIRPALCTQVREGRLHVFLPYIPVLADYLDLIAAIEDTAAHLATPIWIEGYTPPHDPRLRAFSLTPDPGVLEVNLPPAATWDALEEANTILAEEAEANRLIPSKFAYDGTHLATGGGSHIVLGGRTALDSPILRRPDLLRSMLAFWQNHPSLAYLFSGMYVGPTSQYPRVDEARTDALYELQLAFSHIPPRDCPPDILGGLFRNLLVDVSGNTHRAEFCIDKLYPPEGMGLRAGLLELRAFEMPPHVRMNLAQFLLVRALAAAFWRTPFTAPLIPWGPALHDRFMLPHFVRQDFAEVLAFLRQAGFAFEDAWYATHHEFRFPKIGSVAAEGLELELRQALEPWNVLAEETTAGGTGRSVDSSLERMQLRLTGADPRYLVTCNGRPVPLHPTTESGVSIAGIRYRARRLYAASHPTIPVHTPLTFDLIDTLTRRALARCTYHAAPPDGAVFTTRPTSAAEARARRQLRFVASPPPSGPVTLPPAETNALYPMTLDLRWPPPGTPS